MDVEANNFEHTLFHRESLGRPDFSVRKPMKRYSMAWCAKLGLVPLHVYGNALQAAASSDASSMADNIYLLTAVFTLIIDRSKVRKDNVKEI